MIITAGIYKGRKIIAPDERITRPTLSKIRMGVFNTLYSIMGDFEGKTFLDVFGGSGIMGLEALSRGFSKVIVFEKNKSAFNIIKRNYDSLGIKANIKLGDSLKLIENLSEVFDAAYIDPPYESGIYEKAVKKTPAKIIIAEHSNIINFDGVQIIKQKIYSGKFISFLSK